MLVGPLSMCALLLGAAGVAKLWSPTPARAALYATGLPSATGVVVGLGLFEVAVATSAFAFGGRLVALGLAMAYGGFALFVGWGWRSGRLSACGCFGDVDVAPGAIHVVFNTAAAALAIAAVAWPVAPIDVVLADQPWAGVPFGAVVVLGAVLGWAVLTVLVQVGDDAARSTGPTPFALVERPS